MGIRAADFWDMTPRELFAAAGGFHEKEMFRQRQDWERTRWAAALNVNMQLPKGQKIAPIELVEFDWEKKQAAVERPKLSAEQLNKIHAAFDRHAVEEAEKLKNDDDGRGSQQSPANSPV